MKTAMGRRGFGVIEILVILGILALVVAALMPSLCRSRETANRVKCASNLRQIGQAMLIYANDNRGAYPRLIYVPGAALTSGTGASSNSPFSACRPNDVTGALFLLLRTQDITSEVFTCPSSNAEKDLYGGGANGPINRSNFSSVKQNLSYSMHNPYNGHRLKGEIEGEFALLADINPGLKDGDNVLAVKSNSSQKDMRQANSNNHDKDGMNVFYADGHVAWQANPFCGANCDNIYTTQNGKVEAAPVDFDDSILLPTDD